MRQSILVINYLIFTTSSALRLGVPHACYTTTLVVTTIFIVGQNIILEHLHSKKFSPVKSIEFQKKDVNIFCLD